MSRQSRPATVQDVAREAEVSTATVSRVFSGKAHAVTSSTAERVRQVAAAMGYTPSEIGRSLRSATTRMVVMLVPDSTNDFCAHVSVSVERALAEIGLSMVLMNSGEDAERQDRLLADAESLRPRAILLLGAIDTPRLQAMAQTNRKLIFISRRPTAAIRAPFIGIDNVAAGRMVARHFLDRGYRRCAVIHGPRRYSASQGRLIGFLEALAEAGIPQDQVRQIESPLTMEDGYARGKDLCAGSDRPQAVFCGNDLIAYGIQRAAVEARLRIPQDLAICGFDDNRINEWLAPWLTSVRVPALEIGPAVLELLNGTQMAHDDASVLLPFSLTERSST